MYSFWYDEFKEEFNNSDLKTQPIFNRDGWYYDRMTKLSWIEFNGKAKLDDNPSYFIYTLKHESHKRLSSKERDAIKVLMSYNRCPKELIEADRIEYAHLEITRTRRDMSLSLLRFRKENDEHHDFGG